MDLELNKAHAYELIIDPLLEFMEDWDDCNYTREDVEQCLELLENYLTALASMTEPDDDAIMAEVKTLVLALNDLNEATYYTLIETDSREAICEVIQETAIEAGLQNYSDDITEEWRDW